jgi:non-specific serine/threonine protein kinase
LLVGCNYAKEGRTDDAMREVRLAMTLRSDDPIAFYNAACIYCIMNNTPDAISALSKAWQLGYRDANWVRRDPDLVPLHGNPEFERLYPAPEPQA